MSAKLTKQLSFSLLDSGNITISVVVDNANAQNSITVAGIGFYSNITVYRVINSVATPIRGGFQVPISGVNSEVFTDYECQLDVAVTYRAVLDDGTTVESTPVSIVTDGRTFWLKDVILGIFSVKVQVQAMSDVIYPANVLASFKILGRQNPVLVTDVRAGRTGTMTLSAFSVQDMSALRNLIASGNTLMFQAPGSANFPDMYFQAGDVSETWNGISSGLIHTFVVPFTETDAPSGQAFALATNSWLLVTQFGTWQNVLDKRATWKDVLVTPYSDLDALPITPVPSPQPLVSAFISNTNLGAADFNSALANWVSLTGIDLPVCRYYMSNGDFSTPPNLAQMIAAGKKICITLNPDVNPVNPAHLASINSMLSGLKAQGADLEVTLHHEPFFGSISSTDYVNMVKYYGPTVRNYYRLWACFSGNDATEANGYYPGDGWLDGIAVDDYATSTQSIDDGQAMADAHGLPFSIWEFNVANDLGIDPSPVTSVSNATSGTFFTYIKNVFQNRMAAGKPCGPILFFSATGTTTGTANFLTTQLSQNGGFNGGVGNWVGGSAATVLTSAQAHSGTQSLQATCTSGGTANFLMCTGGNILTQGMAVAPAQQVAVSGWMRAATTGRSCTMQVTFYDSGGASISTLSGSNFSDNTTGWTFGSAVVTAPALSAWCRITVQMLATGVGEVHYFDDPQISVLPASIDHTAPVQYSWDYRIPLLADLKSTIEALI